MNNHRIFAIVLTVLLMAFMISACTPPVQAAATAAPAATQAPADTAQTAAPEQTAAVDNTPIRVGTQPTTMGTPLDYAMKQGWFEEAGITVERVLFPTGAPINEALAAKQLDIALNGLATVYAVAAGDVTWIGEINTATGLAVYVRPDSPVLKEKGNVEGFPNIYGSVDTLKGLTILGPLGTSAQFNVITWMNKFGLTASDYKMLSMDHGPAAQAFLSGEGDAIASSPPYTYQLEEAGMVKVATLEDTSGITLMDGMCVDKQFLADHRDLVKRFTEIIYRAQELLGNDDKLVYDVCMQYFNENGREYDETKMNNEIKERDFVDKDIMTAPDYKFGAVLFGMGKFYVDDGKIDPADYPNIATGVDPSILEEIYGIKINVYQDQ